MAETRKELHQRILQHGPAGPADYEAVKYLADSGLAKAAVRLSYHKENYGQAVEVVWVGATASGMDYLEDMSAADAKLSVSDSGDNPNPEDGGEKYKGLAKKPKQKRLKHLVQRAASDIAWSTVKAVIGVVAGAISIYYISKHFGLPL